LIRLGRLGDLEDRAITLRAEDQWFVQKLALVASLVIVHHLRERAVLVGMVC